MPSVYPLLLAGLAAAAPAKRQGTSCAALTAPDVPGASITSITPTEVNGVCRVSAYLTHDNATDNVHIITWLPLTGWNGRYQGTGGSGFTAGGSTSALVQPVADGFVAGTTDAGLPNSFDGTAFADDDQLIDNFAYLSIHEMTVVGKALAAQMYGEPVKYSYWNGCSTGGRQGYMEAQKYPEDYQGVYSASPAINWDRFHVAMLWPFVVQNVEGEFVPQCVFTALTNAAIEFCDEDDGAKDNLIASPNTCKFDAMTMVGKSAACSGTSSTITERQALIFNKIAYGPVDAAGNKLYTGIALGTDLSSLASTTPFPLASGWTRSYVLKDPDYDLKQITYETFPGIIAKAHADWHERIGTDDPDLSAFRDAGGKLVSWHGWADQLIFGNGTAQYRLRVQDEMNGAEKVDEFYRLFMAPGVQHCSGGTGAAPTDPLGALIAWVENGTAPDTLPASGNGITRNLCRFPLELQYSGSGDINSADSWTCA